MIEEGDGLGGQGWRAREEKGVDIGELGVGDGLGGVRWHLGVRLADVSDERRERNLD